MLENGSVKMLSIQISLVKTNLKLQKMRYRDPLQNDRIIFSYAVLQEKQCVRVTNRKHIKLDTQRAVDTLDAKILFCSTRLSQLKTK